MRRLSYSFLIGLTLFASGCTPSVRVPDSKTMDKIFQQSDEARSKSLAEELDAMQRKAEILDRLNAYSPFIRMINVYVPGRQLPTGGYTHPQIVSTPLIYNQHAIKVSSATIEALSNTTNVQQTSQQSGASQVATGTQAAAPQGGSSVNVYTKPQTIVQNNSVVKPK